MSSWLQRYSTLAFATQSDLTTETTSGFLSLHCGSDVQPDLAREMIEMELLEGVVGASSAPIVGSKHGGKVKFRVPLQGAWVGYDPAADSLADKLPPEFALQAMIFGSNAGAPWVQTYVNAAVDAGSSTTSIVTKAGTALVGGFWVSAAAATGAGLVTGWVKSKSGSPGAETLTLAEAATATPAENDKRYPSATIAITNDAPTPLTIRYLGGAGTLGYAFIGCVAEEIAYGLDAKAVPVLELSYVFTSYKRLASSTSLSVPQPCYPMPPLMADKNARITMGGVAKAGIGAARLVITTELGFVDDINGAQGVSAVFVVKKTVKFSCNVPLDSADSVTDGAGPWDTMLENATTTSLCVTVGRVLGRIWSLWLPALRLSAQPKLAVVNGYYVHQLEFEAAPYTDDGGSTAPADTPGRIGMS